jgi:ATP-dependent helicase/nuclease subunit B
MGLGSREGGLRIVFDPAIDGAAWPGPLAQSGACFGETWLGPLGLIGRLETDLGLGGALATRTERIAELARGLAGVDGYWSASFERAQLATSARLLTDRDTLALWGWRGEAVSPRLAALWRATSNALPGIPDRLERILQVIRRRDIDIQSIRIADPLESLPPLWARVFEVLATLGVRLDPIPVCETPSTGDLAAARRPGFTPVADGSLTLIRPHGPLAAADEVAAALAALDSLDGVVLIGPDAVLDEALGRHGLPRAGADVAPSASAALVRLVLETAFGPMNPADLHGLLCAEPGPVPRGIARRLAGVLRSLPGRGSPEWCEALARGLSEIEETRRSSVAERLRTIFDPLAERGGEISFEQLQSRLRALTTWARGRVETDGTLSEVIGMAETLLQLASRMGRKRLGRLELRGLCDEIDRPAAARFPAEAGLASIPRPGAMLGPTDFAVWWGFTRDRAPARLRLRLSEAERTALRRAGVTPPDAGAEMASEARRWRRPLLFTSRALVLVCPYTGEAGELAHPHPLWDELTSTMTDTRLAHLLEARQLMRPAAAVRQLAELRPNRVAVGTARAGRSLALRSVESPSSIERLLGCSLAWALEYPGGVRRGFASGPPDPSPVLSGVIAHHLLAGLFSGEALRADEAARVAEARLEAELPRLCETLCLPDHQVERAELKSAVVRSAREIARVLERTGASVVGTEVVLRGGLLDGAILEGTADLLLANPDLVIDFKWGITSSRKRLASGSALQLAAYADLCRSGTVQPQVAYFIVNRQRMLAEPGTCLTDADCPGESSAAEMWRGVQGAIEKRRDELARGDLAAPGALEDPEDSALEDGVMRIAPACRYCELDTICGRRGGS